LPRVAVFIDGFNFYHGLRAKHDRKYLWLDLAEVARRLCKSGDVLVGVHYFTAAVRPDTPSRQNQLVYLDALAEVGGITVTFGRYREKQVTCRHCETTWRTSEEKETDVHIAVALLAGVARDAFDTAMVVSADSDLCPAIRAVGELDPAKRVVVVFPPDRHSDDLRRAADAAYPLADAVLRRSLLPEVVAGPGGAEHRRPARWH
jgi:uncharacterized LabA/DUF88 family protein